MKQSAFILLMMVFTVSCNSDGYILKSDLEASNLKGTIVKIERTVHKTGAKSKCPCSGLDEDKQTVYTYNEKGNLTELKKLDEDGNIVHISRYSYNRQGVCTGIDNYLTGDKPAGKELNTLRGKKVTEVKVVDEGGDTESVYKYEYSGSDLTVGKTFNKSGDLLSSFQNAYVNGQLETRTEKNILLDITTVTQYKRNEANDISEYTVTNSNENTGYVFKLEYEYDDKGNWTKQTQYYNGEIAGIVLRNITYYN